jgi:hypothetical protein
MPIIPTISKAEAGGLTVQGQSGESYWDCLKNKTQSQFDMVRDVKLIKSVQPDLKQNPEPF